MAAVNEISPERLRQLAQLRADGDRVLSVYLNLDPMTFATPEARSSEISSVLDGAHREIERGERPHEERLGLRRDLERVGEFLRGQNDWAKEARGVAVFASTPLELFETVRVPQPVPSEYMVGPSPYVEPLAEIGPAGCYCVALIDGRWARMLRGSEYDLREVVSFGDDVPPKTKGGGWSQANFQRSQRKDVQDHIRHAASVLYDMYRREPCALLLIGAPEERWAMVLDALHPDLQRVLGERLQIEVAHASVADVNRIAGAAIDARRREHEDAVLARLRDGLGAGGRATAGLAAVLDALVARRVEVLLYDAGLVRPGRICPRDGWLGESGERCPVDDTPLVVTDNVVEAAVEAALRQSAEVMALRDRPDLGPLGSIAALLHF
jgi:peptide subunit release factor 1 (eRF1)